MARSQARRILLRLDEFQEIVFDFRNVTFMGQGFADEVFRVFQNAHPDIRITVVNANRDIQGMIAHVKKHLKTGIWPVLEKYGIFSRKCR